jgi:hypothetical protein
MFLKQEGRIAEHVILTHSEDETLLADDAGRRARARGRGTVSSKFFTLIPTVLLKSILR